MFEIGLGAGLFTALVLLLVLAILGARSRLVATGRVAVVVNETKTVAAPVGGKLLDILAEAGIYLPSGCGGVGTCGQCRVQVLEGGGAILPTERTRITKREADRGARLACQVTLKQDMIVQVPDEVFGVQQWRCTVRSNRSIATLIKELVLDLPPGETVEFRAGSYVQIACPAYRARFEEFDIGPEYRAEWDRLGLWRYQVGTTQPTTRAYSMANYPDEDSFVMLDVRIAIPPPGAPESVPPGVVSSYLFGLRPGDQVTVLGPYGHFFATPSDREMVFVGGGVGMAPMRCHIFDQLERLKSGRKISFWYGARNRRELLYKEDFDRLQAEHSNFEWFVALSDPGPTDDWRGPTGFIHEVLYRNYLKDHPAPEDCEYYICGPPVMMRAVMNMLDSLGVDPDNIFFDPDNIFFDDFGG
jgi:Na+-transporting NADH:ubiquinone oxidoreductase subunit F